MAVLGWDRARRISACGRCATRRRIEFNDVFVPYFAVWSSGLIPASGAGGPGFNSRNRHWFMRIALFVGSAHVAIRKCRQYETWFGVQKPTPVGLEPAGIEPGTSCTRIGNHTTRPNNQVRYRDVVEFNPTARCVTAACANPSRAVPTQNRQVCTTLIASWRSKRLLSSVGRACAS